MMPELWNILFTKSTSILLSWRFVGGMWKNFGVEQIRHGAPKTCSKRTIPALQKPHLLSNSVVVSMYLGFLIEDECVAWTERHRF
jgi:hypothetical protein